MENSKFKVGQKWGMRNGEVVTIIKILPDYPYPIRTEKHSFEKDGRWWGSNLDVKYDLVKLVEN